MGISLNPFAFLVGIKEPLGKTLVLGRQDNNLRHPEKIQLAKVVINHYSSKINLDKFIHEKYADNLFKELGATELDFLDINDYEGGNVFHDLNKPLPESLYGKYDSVIDGGTLEHVYHVPNALNSIARLLNIGGRYIGMHPANNFLNHGFYQISPELMLNFCFSFGFKINRLDLYIRTPGLPVIFPLPTTINGDRTQYNTPNMRVDLFTEATKESDAYPEFLYQYDYSHAWNEGKKEHKVKTVTLKLK